MEKKGQLSNVLLVAVFVIGLSLLLYPSVSNYWNSFHQSRAIASYAEKVANLSNDEYEECLRQAREYNTHITERQNLYSLTDAEKNTYNSLLNVSGSGVMGCIEIPSIEVTLPVYHGTEDTVLQIAAGHLEWTSLPVGGLGTHCVLSGHRGLPSAKLFTSLDKLVVGDVFMLLVLDEMLTYEVDQILIVQPENISDLQIVPGQDYCTLVTCTPYGINTHRLLVHGRRIENTASGEAIRISSEAFQIEPVIVSSVVAIPLLILILIFVFAFG